MEISSESQNQKTSRWQRATHELSLFLKEDLVALDKMLKAVQASAACEVFPMIWKALRQLQVKRKQLDKLNKKLDKFQPQEFRKDLVYSWQIRPS